MQPGGLDPITGLPEVQLGITKRNLICYEDNELKPVSACVTMTRALLGEPQTPAHENDCPHVPRVAQGAGRSLRGVYLVKCLRFFNAIWIPGVFRVPSQGRSCKAGA